MPRVLRIPDTNALPSGPVREFVVLLFDYHRIACHPKLKEICKGIDALPLSEDERKGTASRETVRRMFHGHVPSDWHTVEVVFLALCQMAGVDPDRRVKYTYWDHDGDEVLVNTDRRSQMREAWSDARYGLTGGRAPFQGVDFDYEEPEPPPQRAGSASADDPWATAGGGGGFSDDPPF